MDTAVCPLFSATAKWQQVLNHAAYYVLSGQRLLTFNQCAPSRTVENVRVQTFLARQPIFDRRGDVYGYELLFRSAADGKLVSPEATTMQPPRGKWSPTQFLHRPRKSPVRQTGVSQFRPFFAERQSAPDLFERRRRHRGAETVEVDEEVIAACAELHKSGFAIALDDFVPGSGTESLLPFAKIIKVDMRLTPRAAQRNCCAPASSNGMVFRPKKSRRRKNFSGCARSGTTCFKAISSKSPKS